MADSSGNLLAVPPPPVSSPRDDEAAARLLASAILLLVLIIIIGGVVACVVSALCLRVRRTWHNSKERRRLTKRAAWLRDLLQLLPPPAPPAPAEEEEMKGGAGSGGSATAAVRTVLARRIEATVSEVDRLVASASMSSMSYCGCCLLAGFARSYELARRLERANKDVDEVYSHLLPVVTQIDAAHRVEQVLVGVMQQQQQLRDKNSHHSDVQGAAAQTRPNGSNEFDWKPLLSENNDDQASIGTAAFEITVDR